MGLSKYEQETIISFNRTDSSAELYTADPYWMRKMDKLIAKNPEQFHELETLTRNGEIISKKYSFPKKFISIRSKDIAVNWTDEQKKIATKRLQDYWKKQKDK